MVLVSYSGREINAKLVYYGPGLSGKTTNLEYIYGSIPQTQRGKMVSMKTKTERTLFFDFLPVDLGELSGFKTRFLLYTVPGQVYYNATRKLVLKGVDAVVFVADSKRGKMDENVESLANLRENLRENGLDLGQVPWVMQYNKRDLPEVYSVAELDQVLNPGHVPAYEAVATTGAGVVETFKAVSRLLLRKLAKEIGVQVVSAPQEALAVPLPKPAPAPVQILTPMSPLAAEPVPVPAPVHAPEPVLESVLDPVLEPTLEPAAAFTPEAATVRPEPMAPVAIEPVAAPFPEPDSAGETPALSVGERLRRWLSGSTAQVREETTYSAGATEPHPEGIPGPTEDAPAFASPILISPPAGATVVEAPPVVAPLVEVPLTTAWATEVPTTEAPVPPQSIRSEPVQEEAPQDEPPLPQRPASTVVSLPPRRPATGSPKPREVIVPLSLEPRDLETGVVLRIAFQMPSQEEEDGEISEAA